MQDWQRQAHSGGFTFTSNVDGQHQRAGTSVDRVVECHGSIHHLQCTHRFCGGGDEGIWENNHTVRKRDKGGVGDGKNPLQATAAVRSLTCRMQLRAVTTALHTLVCPCFCADKLTIAALMTATMTLGPQRSLLMMQHSKQQRKRCRRAAPAGRWQGQTF